MITNIILYCHKWQQWLVLHIGSLLSFSLSWSISRQLVTFAARHIISCDELLYGCNFKNLNSGGRQLMNVLIFLTILWIDMQNFVCLSKTFFWSFVEAKNNNFLFAKNYCIIFKIYCVIWSFKNTFLKCLFS